MNIKMRNYNVVRIQGNIDIAEITRNSKYI